MVSTPRVVTCSCAIEGSTQLPDAYSIRRSWPTGTKYGVAGLLATSLKDTGVPLSACAMAAARAAELPRLTVEGGIVGFVTVTGSGVLTTFTPRPPGGPAGGPPCAIA